MAKPHPQHLDITQISVELNEDRTQVVLHFMVEGTENRARYFDTCALPPDAAVVLGGHMIAKAGACFALEPKKKMERVPGGDHGRVVDGKKKATRRK